MSPQNRNVLGGGRLGHFIPRPVKSDSFNGKPKASVSSPESYGFPEKQSPAACR